MVQPVNPQMTLFHQTGVPGIIISRYFKLSWLGSIFISPVSSSILLLSVQKIQLLSLLLLNSSDSDFAVRNKLLPA